MQIDHQMLPDLSYGAAFLGSGGGGDPYYSYLLAKAAIQRCGHFDLIDLNTLEDDAFVVPCGWIGAPTVSVEKLPNGGEPVAGLRRLEKEVGRKIDAVLPIEIGGGNGLAPFLAAAALDVPVVDCDGMGRAFPESQMTIFNIHGLSACPSVVTAACGSLAVLETVDNLKHEQMARGVSVALGGIAHMVEYPLTGRQAKESAIPGSISTAISLGAAVRDAKATGENPFEALATALAQSGHYPSCHVLFDGKIVDLMRETRDGFSIGKVTVKAIQSRQQMDIEFQNENLVARSNGRVLAIVPDIITIMDSETAETITTERLKYGQRVKVVAAAAPARLRDPSALNFVGPQAFGFKDEFEAVEILNADQSR